VHPAGHARGVSVPGRQIDHWPPFAHEIVTHHRRPDEIVGAEQLERGGHLLRIEIAAVGHHVLEEPHLVLVNEQRER
jgi:hypothetical protein